MKIDYRQLLQDCIDVGYLTNDMAIVAIDLAKKQINKRQDIPEAAREEALGRFTEKLVRKWENINPENNVRSYITQMAYTSLMDEMRKYQKNHSPDREKLKENQNVTSKNKLLMFSNLLKEAEIPNAKKLTPEQRRLLKAEAMRYFDAGMHDIKIADFFGVSRMTVFRWRRNYKKNGNRFLNEKPRGGDRKSKDFKG